MTLPRCHGHSATTFALLLHYHTVWYEGRSTLLYRLRALPYSIAIGHYGHKAAVPCPESRRPAWSRPPAVCDQIRRSAAQFERAQPGSTSERAQIRRAEVRQAVIGGVSIEGAMMGQAVSRRCCHASASCACCTILSHHGLQHRPGAPSRRFDTGPVDVVRCRPRALVNRLASIGYPRSATRPPFRLLP
eukprot:2410592-Rhodomonas_salina.1